MASISDSFDYGLTDYTISNDWRTDTFSYSAGDALLAHESDAGYCRYYLDDPVPVESFKYYWYETSNAVGGGVRLFDTSGDLIGGAATNNPQWHAKSDSYQAYEFHNPGEYGFWVETNITVDRTNNDLTVSMERMDTGFSDSSTDTLNSQDDVDYIEFSGFNRPGGNPTWDWAAKNIWFDDWSLTYTDPNSPPTADLNVYEV